MGKDKRVPDFSAPPTRPIYFLYQEGNTYYYALSCCPLNEHWGVGAFRNYLEPNQLGCLDEEPDDPNDSVPASPPLCDHPTCEIGEEVCPVWRFSLFDKVGGVLGRASGSHNRGAGVTIVDHGDILFEKAAADEPPPRLFKLREVHADFVIVINSTRIRRQLRYLIAAWAPGDSPKARTRVSVASKSAYGYLWQLKLENRFRGLNGYEYEEVWAIEKRN